LDAQCIETLHEEVVRKTKVHLSKVYNFRRRVLTKSKIVFKTVGGF